MVFDALDAAFDLGKTAVERIWPDPIKRAEEMRKLEELRQKGDAAALNAQVQLMLGQIEINKIEAAHKSVYVAGWRPFVGWVGGFSLAYTGLLYPLLLWAWAAAQAIGWLPAKAEPPPALDGYLLGGIVSGMLGIGGMRSFDKNKGTQTDKF